jgi:hypothetical protein
MKEALQMYKSGTLPRTNGIGIARPAGWALLVFLMLIPANLFGQMARLLTIDENARVSVSASSSYQFKSNLDGGGDVSIARFGIGISGTTPLSDRTGLGVRMTYDREEYSFSNPQGFAVSNPWSQINRLGLGMRLGYKLNDQWSVGGGPMVQYAGENGANFGDSLMYGGVVSAV